MVLVEGQFALPGIEESEVRSIRPAFLGEVIFLHTEQWRGSLSAFFHAKNSPGRLVIDRAYPETPDSPRRISKAAYM